MAVVLPDTAGLWLSVEVETYWVQHTFILLAPIYLLARGRFRVHRSSAVYWLGYATMGFFHAVVLMWAGYFSFRNLNYMLCPNYPELYPGMTVSCFCFLLCSLSHIVFANVVCVCVCVCVCVHVQATFCTTSGSAGMRSGTSPCCATSAGTHGHSWRVCVSPCRAVSLPCCALSGCCVVRALRAARAHTAAAATATASRRGRLRQNTRRRRRTE